VRERPPLLEPFDLALAIGRDDPEALAAERQDGYRADRRNGPAALVCQGSGWMVISA
jgi:hypothetical protein